MCSCAIVLIYTAYVNVLNATPVWHATVCGHSFLAKHVLMGGRTDCVLFVSSDTQQLCLYVGTWPVVQVWYVRM